MAPGSELVPHGTDRWHGSREELKTHFSHQQEAQLYDEGRTNDAPVAGLQSYPEKSWVHPYDTYPWTEVEECIVGDV